MNENLSTLRGDDALRYRIILLIIYCVFIVVIVLLTDGSTEAWLQQLLLQVGVAISGRSPVTVTP